MIVFESVEPTRFRSKKKRFEAGGGSLAMTTDKRLLPTDD